MRKVMSSGDNYTLRED